MYNRNLNWRIYDIVATRSQISDGFTEISSLIKPIVPPKVPQRGKKS